MQVYIHIHIYNVVAELHQYENKRSLRLEVELT